MGYVLFLYMYMFLFIILMKDWFIKNDLYFYISKFIILKLFKFEFILFIYKLFWFKV